MQSSIGTLTAVASRRFLAGLLVIQSLLLGWCAWRDSFTWDEIAHLPSGLFHWEFGNFDLYRVNPPLVRMVATLPVLAAGYEANWDLYTPDIRERPEWPISRRFLERNGERSFWLLTLARWACLPFSWLGMWVCWKWSRELFGELAGCLSATLWCFSPNILAHGHLITPDVAGTSFGIAAFYVLWRWLREPSWSHAAIAGIVFGLAQASKSSWIILFGWWPVLWMVWRGRALFRGGIWRREGAQMLVMLLIGWWSINAWYGFEGSFRRLGDYQFLSRALSGLDSDSGQPGNKFAETWLAKVPVPLPRNYVQGIDRQKHHFERPDSSYLRGEWRAKGWWHYYVYAVAVKEPLGSWLLGLLAIGMFVSRQAFRTDWRTECLLLVTLCVLLFFISSQRGFNRHLRYVLPVFPLAFVWLGRVAVLIEGRSWRLASLGTTALLWSVGSCLFVCPHFLSYFNEVAGGPTNGHAHLLSSNVDWGQDLLYLKRWVESHPDAKPFKLKWHVTAIDPGLFGLNYAEPPTRPEPGWYAISVADLRGRGGKYRYFLDVPPVAWAGYSLPIYHLTASDCVQLEQTMNWLPLTANWDVVGHGGQEIRTCALSADERWLATGSEDQSVRVWDWRPGPSQPSRKWAHRAAVTSMTFLKHSNRLVTGCADGTMQICDLDTGDCQVLPSPHRRGVNQMSRNSDGSRFATVSQEGRCCVWDVHSLSILWQIERTIPAISVAFSSNDRWVAVGFGMQKPKATGEACVYAAASGSLIAQLPESDDFVKGIDFSPDNLMLAARGDGGDLKTWSTGTWKPQRNIPNSSGTSRLRFLGDESHDIGLLSADFRGEMKLWDTTGAELLVRVPSHQQLINDFVVTEDQSQLITVSRDGTIRAWNLRDVISKARGRK